MKVKFYVRINIYIVMGGGESNAVS